MIRRVLRMATLLLMATQVGNAAPFCMDVAGIPLQCIYADPGQCQTESFKQGGYCSAKQNGTPI